MQGNRGNGTGRPSPKWFLTPEKSTKPRNNKRVKCEEKLNKTRWQRWESRCSKHVWCSDFRLHVRDSLTTIPECKYSSWNGAGQPKPKGVYSLVRRPGYSQRDMDCRHLPRTKKETKVKDLTRKRKIGIYNIASQIVCFMGNRIQ